MSCLWKKPLEKPLLNCIKVTTGRFLISLLSAGTGNACSSMRLINFSFCHIAASCQSTRYNSKHTNGWLLLLGDHDSSRGAFWIGLYSLPIGKWAEGRSKPGDCAWDKLSVETRSLWGPYSIASAVHWLLPGWKMKFSLGRRVFGINWKSQGCAYVRVFILCQGETAQVVPICLWCGHRPLTAVLL